LTRAGHVVIQTTENIASATLNADLFMHLAEGGTYLVLARLEATAGQRVLPRMRTQTRSTEGHDEARLPARARHYT
jgi:hypothetical protein